MASSQHGDRPPKSLFAEVGSRRVQDALAPIVRAVLDDGRGLFAKALGSIDFRYLGDLEEGDRSIIQQGVAARRLTLRIGLKAQSNLERLTETVTGGATDEAVGIEQGFGADTLGHLATMLPAKLVSGALLHATDSDLAWSKVPGRRYLQAQRAGFEERGAITLYVHEYHGVAHPKVAWRLTIRAQDLASGLLQWHGHEFTYARSQDLSQVLGPAREDAKNPRSWYLHAVGNTLFRWKDDVV